MSFNWKNLFKRSTARYEVENPSEKNFLAELNAFNSKLHSRQNFALVRFGDGEMIIINGKAIDLSQKYNGEHQYIPGEPVHELQRELLHKSLTWQAPYYYVGIACPCCVGTPLFLSLKKQSKQPELQLTWANIFVNSNYSVFTQETVMALSERTVNMVCHQKADVGQLPFEVVSVFRSGPNSWLNDHERLLEQIASHIESNNTEGEVFLFCAGVLSNILVYQLCERYPDNTYIDIGSVFDSTMGLGKTRSYLRSGRMRGQTCVWL